jgi:hypothetical protein
MDPNVKDSIIARLKEATNVLVTVSSNPSVDQLAACIGFTLLLNKVGKRGAAVFSGAVPSTLEFLQPDKTIEKNTDSLRDFIIALDKSKADKLRYKVEDKVVKIFITPYRTSISDRDLDFSQGDFNVDVVIALGVHEKAELDDAIVSHGRILHDATVISVNNKDQGNLGTLNWVDLQASSLSEMMASVGQLLGGAEAFDNQIATALMTGIVAETDRFSNAKTSPATMKLASELMGAGANQQLIATKLDQPAAALSDVVSPEQSEDGELTIEHDVDNESDETDDSVSELEVKETEKPSEPEPSVEPELNLPEPQSEPVIPLEEPEPTPSPEEPIPSRIDNVRPGGMSQPRPTPMSLQPPTMGGKLTANSEPEHLNLDPSTDPLSVGATKSGDDGIISRKSPASIEPTGADLSDNTPAVPRLDTASLPASPAPVETEAPEEQIEDAREAVDEAIKVGGDPEKNLEPIQALGAQPVNLNLGHESDAPDAPSAIAPAPTLPATPSPPTDDDPALPSFDEALKPPATLSGDVSMPPNTFNTPPSPMNPPIDSDLSSSMNAMPQPSDVPTVVPSNLMPPSAPEDRSGTSGPATPPPPVPPPMAPMPNIPPQPPAGALPPSPNLPR